MRSAYLRVRTEFGKGDTLRLQIMVAATLAITLIAGSCGGGDQGDGTTGVATLVGADSPAAQRTPSRRYRSSPQPVRRSAPQLLG